VEWSALGTLAVMKIGRGRLPRQRRIGESGRPRGAGRESRDGLPDPHRDMFPPARHTYTRSTSQGANIEPTFRHTRGSDEEHHG
jgi:hypothetical protein